MENGVIMRFNSKKAREILSGTQRKYEETYGLFSPALIDMNNGETLHDKKIQAMLSLVNPQEYFRLEALSVLYRGVISGNFVILKKACEYACVTRQEIYDSSFTMISDIKTTYPELVVFLDMMFVIGEKAKTDHTISHYVLWLAGMEEGLPQNQVPRNFQDYLTFYNDPDRHRSMASSFFSETMKLGIEEKTKFFYGKTDRGLDIFQFNDGESVLKSKQYARYLEKRYEDLAKYVETLVGHPVDKESVFDELLKCYNNPRHGLARLITAGANAVSDLKDFRFGGSEIRQTITASDIKELVNSWMCGFIVQEMQKFEKEHHESISKLYLARVMIPEPEKVYNDVSFMYEKLVLHKKANQLVDEQYKHFTWESVIKGSEAQKSQETIDELRHALDACQQKLKTANESIDIYKEKVAGLQKQTAKVQDPNKLGHIERRYENLLTERDEEIARLQQELHSRERYIEIISASSSETQIESTINPDILYSKKYLFVGVIRDEFVELKRKFPNSIFMETAQYNPSNIIVDMIVYLIPTMSHALYYKVQNTNALNDVKRIYCNNRSANNVLMNIYAALMDE